MSNIPYGFIQKNDGQVYVEENQAKIVKLIYQRYLTGDSLGVIADLLFRRNTLSPSGNEKWTRSVIDNMLTNSKYIGYIISFDDYFAVQVEKGNRSNIDEDNNQRKTTRYSSQSVLSGLLVCAECGGANYRRITRLSGEVVWRCANRVEYGKKICHYAPSILEDDLKNAICAMLDIPEFDPQAVKENLELVRISSDGSMTPEFILRECSVLRL